MRSPPAMLGLKSGKRVPNASRCAVNFQVPVKKRHRTQKILFLHYTSKWNKNTNSWKIEYGWIPLFIPAQVYFKYDDKFIFIVIERHSILLWQLLFIIFLPLTFAFISLNLKNDIITIFCVQDSIYQRQRTRCYWAIRRAAQNMEREQRPVWGNTKKRLIINKI